MILRLSLLLATVALWIAWVHFKTESILHMFGVNEKMLYSICVIKREKVNFLVNRMSFMLSANLQMAVLWSFSLLLKKVFFSLCNQTAYITIFIHNANFVWIMMMLCYYRSSLLFFCNMHANNIAFVIINIVFSCKCVSAVFNESSGNVLCCTVFSTLSPERTSWKIQYSWLNYKFFMNNYIWHFLLHLSYWVYRLA